MPQATAIDKKNGNTLWKNEIENKMQNVITSYQLMEGSENFPIGYQNIKLHMVFDVKMDFTRKACLVSRVHTT